MAKKRLLQPAFMDSQPEWIAQVMDTRHVDKLYERLDIHQVAYYQGVIENPVVLVDEVAGTGKTTIAIMAALELLRTGTIASIIYVRFPDRRTEKLGFRPGELEDKESVYMTPVFDALAECGIQPEAAEKLQFKGLLELTTDISMRGRNLKKCCLIIDEAQNGTIEDLRLLLTRLHDDGSRVIVIGHSGQMDTCLPKYEGLNAFQVYQKHMTKKPWAKTYKLPVNYRGKISKWADSIDETIQEVLWGK